MSPNRSDVGNRHLDISRREFLRLGAVGAAGLGLSHRAQFASAAGGGGRCDSVIFLWMQGGVSHLDTFDPKPDAPAEIRGPFRAISTNVPGIQLCEHLPRMARVSDKIAFIRSMHHTEGSHEHGMSYMLSGCKPLPGISHLGFGAVVSRTLAPRGVAPSCISVSGDGFFQRGACAAFDLDVEPQRIQEAYGYTALGRKCLAARRLVEAGARFVTVEENGWDHHFRAFDSLVNRLPQFDRAVSALMVDLADRGLLDKTMVVFATEFGRSPRINNEAGREHHPSVFSCFLAGGGIRGGCVVGASDARGESPASRPVTPEDLLRTIDMRLGASGSGQSMGAAFGGGVIHELA